MDNYVYCYISRERKRSTVNMKKLLALILALMMLTIYILPAGAFSQEAIYGQLKDIKVNPGNPRSDSPEYSFAWLDNVVVRYDPSAVTSATITPKPADYLYSETYEEFLQEVNSYSKLFELDEETVGLTYRELSTTIFYAVTAMGFTDTQENMREYLRGYGIRLPITETFEDKTAIAVVYAALKYDAVYVLYNKHVSIPVGSTLDEALVMILSALTGTMLPSGIDSLTGLAVLVMKNYVTQFKELPVSENPDAAEIFHWAKVITAAKNEYKVPLDQYDMTTKAQKEYVDYAYYASILNTLYDINVNPIYLVLAMQSKQENALQKFILETMLDEKKVSYTKEMSCRQLFDLACKNGFFELEQELYCDIFDYELVVPSGTEKIWFTPFCLAGQLQGSNEAYITIYLNGVQMAQNTTMSTPVDPAKATEKIELKVIYDDKAGVKDEAVYTFHVVKDKALNDKREENADKGLVGEVENFIGTIIPNDNGIANVKVNQIFDSIGEAVAQVGSDAQQNLLTTYSVDGTENPSGLDKYEIDEATAVAPAQDAERFDFAYLEELINGVYVTDAEGNIVTTMALSSGEAEEDGQNIIEKVGATVKESPEVVAVPSSLLAAFGFVGYFMSKKHRDSYADDDEATEEKE